MWYHYSETLHHRILNMILENHVFFWYNIIEVCINIEDFSIFWAGVLGEGGHKSPGQKYFVCF